MLDISAGSAAAGATGATDGVSPPATGSSIGAAGGGDPHASTSAEIICVELLNASDLLRERGGGPRRTCSDGGRGVRPSGKKVERRIRVSTATITRFIVPPTQRSLRSHAESA